MSAITLDFGISIADLFSQVGAVMGELWPVIAVMASISIGFWIARRVKGFATPGGRGR